MKKLSPAEKEERRRLAVVEWRAWGERFGWQLRGWHEPDERGNDMATFERDRCVFIVHRVQRGNIDTTLSAVF